VCEDSKANRSLVQGFRGSTATHTTAVFAAGMLGDLLLSSSRTVGIELPHARCKPNEVLVIALGPAHGRPGAPRLPGRGVCRAFPFRLLEGALLHQLPLTIAPEGLQSVRRRYAQVTDASGNIEHLKLPLRDCLKGTEAPRRPSAIEGFRVLAAERLDHG